MFISFFFWASKYSFVLKKYTLLSPTDDEIQLGVFALQMICEKAEKIRLKVPYDESYGIIIKDKEEGEL